MVIGTRVLRQHLGNLLAYYSGEECWKTVDWELLFGTAPYPTTEIIANNELADSAKLDDAALRSCNARLFSSPICCSCRYPRFTLLSHMHRRVYDMGQ